MVQKTKKRFFTKTKITIFISALAGALLVFGGKYVYKQTSTDEACQACHIHPHAEDSWKLSTHVNNPSGVKVHCVECHLPPEQDGFKHFTAKTKIGIKDLWSYLTKDSTEINWESKKSLVKASKYVYNESCKECHANIFPTGLSDEGITAHLYYEENEKKLDLQCISCHMGVGHYDPNMKHEKMQGIPTGANKDNRPIFNEPAIVTKFENFTEQIPGTPISFQMKAIQGGTYNMGSPEDEPFRQANESPVRKVSLSDFFMAEIETTWEQYWAFYAETMSEGRIAPSIIFENNSKNPDVDGISGPTPPFGYPDQGWGGVDRPAITMTHYAAETFCQWLSKKTGKTYRLPTEAEWEYAARGGTQTPYFFAGNPKDFSDKGFWRKFFDADTTGINSFVAYSKNSGEKTMEPSKILPNPFGLKNMLGNVMEYCSDWYDEKAYAQTPLEVTDPKGPVTGTEHVVRGNDYAADASDVRCAYRDATKNEAWLKTDPQQPKSIWWYSDTKSVGFRVVCEKPSPTENTTQN